MPPTVSVNLCCYNSEKYLRETLDSIVNQTYKDWELVIINDGSTDSTESIIKEYIDKGYPIIYHYQENHGLGYSRNEALKRSSGEFIAFIDHDDLWMPEKLEKQIALFNDDNVGIVACNAIQFSNDGCEALFCRKKLATGYVFRDFLGNYSLCLSTVVVSKKALFSLDDWFDIRFNHIEEFDLFTRIAYKWHFDYVYEPLAKNRIHKESSSYLRPDLSPKETEMMLNKFIRIFPNFEQEYKKEIIKMRFYIQYYYALLDWKDGNNKLVRQRLESFLFRKPKAIFPYCASILPYQFYSRLIYFYRQYLRRVPVA